MANDIYNLAGELKEMLDNDERIIRLNALEKELNNNEEVMALSYQKDVAVSAYSDALNYYAKDSEEMKKYQKYLKTQKKRTEIQPTL